MFDLFWKILLVASCIWVEGYLYYGFMQQVAEEVTIDLRANFLRALLQQEVAFFEQNNVEQMPSDVGQYFTQINKGIGENAGQLAQAFGTFCGGLGISFYRGPVFAAICLAYFPVVLIIVGILG